MLCGRHVYSRCRISYSLLHKSVYMMRTAWSRKGTDMFRRSIDSYTRERITFMSLQRSVYFTYIVGSMRYRYYWIELNWIESLLSHKINNHISYVTTLKEGIYINYRENQDKNYKTRLCLKIDETDVRV